ncbi:family 61 putative glycoside hydrolase [Leptodontidium sp. 2 PMI_412]|nr:family 61 putative glycoside hydrolase [Leptodontidium sp. 2 PMI_412]
MLFSTVFSAASLLVAQVSAHGAVTSYQIGTTIYQGYQGYSPSSSPASIQRQWTDGYNPITSVTSAKMLCNGGTSAALSAPIVAGNTITAKWAQWTHQQGPVMVWMYKCAGEFTACDGKGKGWFKIDQMGMTAAPLSGTSWGANVVYTKLAYTSTIPKSLAPGNYLIRHELLALHQANAPQFYPECAQLQVSGNGTATPAATFLTTIPGYATANDPGVMVDTYMSKATTYTCPGPAVWTG